MAEAQLLVRGSAECVQRDGKKYVVIMLFARILDTERVITLKFHEHKSKLVLERNLKSLASLDQNNLEKDPADPKKILLKMLYPLLSELSLGYIAEIGTKKRKIYRIEDASLDCSLNAAQKIQSALKLFYQSPALRPENRTQTEQNIASSSKL